jgi:hypothetical protein
MLRAAFPRRGGPRGLLRWAIVPIVLATTAGYPTMRVSRAQEPQPPSVPQAGANSSTPPLESGPKRADDSEQVCTPTLPPEPGPAVPGSSAGPDKRSPSVDCLSTMAPNYFADRSPDKLPGALNAEKAFISADCSARAAEEFSVGSVSSKADAQSSIANLPRSTNSSAQGYIFEAGAYRYRGRYTEAVACYNQALQVDPGNLEAHWGRSSACIKIDRYDLALQDLDVLILLGH